MNNDQVTLKDVCIKFISLVENKKGYWKVALILIILLSIICYFLPAPWRRYWYEDNGHFPWVGISVFIAAVGFFGNQIWERKKLNADIKSKSRIEWMVTVRDLLANFMVESEKIYITLSDLSISTLISTNKESNESKKYNDEKSTLSVTYRKLLLYIPPVEDNQCLLISIQDVWDLVDERCIEAVSITEKYRKTNNQENKDKLNEFIKKIDPNDEEQNVLMTRIDHLNEVGRKYFKHEWERAKRGE